jgi:signal transduction histidine kinase
MTKDTDAQMALMVMIALFVIIAILLVVVLVRSVTRQQRRYLRTRKHLGGRLLTAQDEERAAIARELHDDSVQQLIASATRLRGIDSAVARAVADDLDDLVRGLRDLARGIHPAVVDHVGLDAALADLAASFTEREGIAVDYQRPDMPDQLIPSERLAFYRVTQEALGNVARHANVDRVSLRLTCDASHTTLTIADKGQGFDRRSADHGPGIGVISMRERLMILGGTLDIESSPGSGTRVVATLPQSARST